MRKNKPVLDLAEPVNDSMAVRGSMPLYAQPRPVNSLTHADLSVRVGGEDYSFAAKAPMIPLAVDEFERAALDYPIVLFGDDREPYAVTSLALDSNLFVTDGKYRNGAYIPAYLRRYPFVFARDEGSDALILCLDQGSDRVVSGDTAEAEALFDGDEPSALTRQALSFCESYEGASQRTRTFVRLLDELGLIEEKQAHHTPAGSDTPTLLLTYATIDRARLDALGAEDFQKLRDGQFAGAAHAVVASQAQWDVLPLIAG